MGRMVACAFCAVASLVSGIMSDSFGLACQEHLLFWGGFQIALVSFALACNLFESWSMYMMAVFGGTGFGMAITAGFCCAFRSIYSCSPNRLVKFVCTVAFLRHLGMMLGSLIPTTYNAMYYLLMCVWAVMTVVEALLFFRTLVKHTSQTSATTTEIDGDVYDTELPKPAVA